MASVAVFVAFYSIRKAVSSKAKSGPSNCCLLGIIGFGCVVGAIVASHSLHDMVLGAPAKRAARKRDMISGTPASHTSIKSDHRPWLRDGRIYFRNYTIDSYLLSLILETGVPGLVFFVGLLVLPVWYGLRNYLSDMSESGALAGALACSFIGFIMNRLVLSQKENHMLIFSLLAIVIVLNYEFARKRVPQPTGDKSLRKHISPPRRSVSPGRRLAPSEPGEAPVEARASIGDCLRDFLPWK